MLKAYLSFMTILLTALLLAAQKPVLVIPTGHSSGVHTVSCSADGTYFLTAGDDNLIKIWNAEGRELRTFRREKDIFYSQATLSPDGKQILATAYYASDEAYILDARTGKLLFSLEGKGEYLQAAGFSKDSKTIATASHTGDLALWDAKSGRLLRSWKGHDKTVHALDFSFDGAFLATSSDDGFTKIWDTRTGQAVQSISIEGQRVKSTHFSPDGRALSIGHGGGGEPNITIWSVETGKKMATAQGYDCFFSTDGKFVCVLNNNSGRIHPIDDLNGKPLQVLSAPILSSDTAIPNDILEGQFLPDGKNVILNALYYPVVKDFRTGETRCILKGYAEPVQSAAFSPNGEHCVVGTQKDMLTWDFAEGRPLKRLIGHTANVGAARYTPDGEKIISVAEDFTGRVWGSEKGDSLFTTPAGLELLPVQEYTRLLAVDPKGKFFARGVSQGGGNEFPLLRTYNLSDGSPKDDISGEQQTVVMLQDLDISPDGKWLVATADNALHLWDLKEKRWARRIYRSKEEAFFTYGPVFFATSFNHDSRQIVASTRGSIQYWDVNTGNLIAEKEDNIDAKDLVFSPDGKWMATAIRENIGIWNATNRELITTLSGHDNPVSKLDFSPDSKWLISASTDNTLRLWDIQKGKEAAKIIHLNGRNWAITTPSGLFDASPGAMEMMYFLSGEEVIELEQLKERYYEPGLISKVLGLTSGELRDVQQFKDLPLYPVLNAEIVQSQLNIELTERNGGIGKLSLFINGTERGPVDINPERKQRLSIDLKTYSKYYYRGDTLNTIALRAYNAQGWLKSQAYKLPYAYSAARGSGQGGNTRTLGDAKPHLYALVVGTADYSDDKLDLKYADQDAASVAAALASAGKELFGNDVHIRLFTTGSNVTAAASGGIQNELSSKANIQAAFEAYAKPERAQPSDVLVIYFSGHGITYGEAEKAQFYYLTKDIASEDLSDPEIRRNYTISSEELTEWIKNIVAEKRVLILDACNSGKIVESLASIGKKDLNPSQVRALDHMKDRTGMYIITGSAADMVSYEASQYGQGLLTYSLLEGMSGLALADDKRVDVMTLFQYCRNKVPELAKSINGIQTPVLAFPVDGGSFYIGIVNENVKIPLAQIKPVFIRNVFQDEDAFEDVLGLGDAVEEYFRQQNAKGAQSRLIYVDVKEYANAYSMKGRYTVRAHDVEVRLRLFKGKTVIGEEFKVKGKKDDVPGLVKQILQVVMPMAK